MSDEWEQLRQLRPDRILADEPSDPSGLRREKERLMSAIDDRVGGDATSTKMPDIFPRLAYRDEAAALDYLTRVLQLEEIREARFDMGSGGFLAWLRVGDGVVMIGREDADVHRIHSPLGLGNTSVQFMVSVSDIDSHYAHALSQGAEVTMPLQDAFYGERRYEATDCEGHRWHFSESFDSIRARGGHVPESPTGGLPPDDE